MKETLELLRRVAGKGDVWSHERSAVYRAVIIIEELVAANDGRFGGEWTSEYEGFRFTHDGAKHMQKVFAILNGEEASR